MILDLVLQTLIHYGTVVLFVAVFVEQLGFPAPGAPLLVVTGALCSAGRMAILSSILVPVLACLIADACWYWIGKRCLGRQAGRLNLSRSRLRMYLEHRSAHFFRYGYLVFLAFKFLPGPNMVSVHIGRSGLKRPRLLLFDALASLVWVGGYIAAGFMFSNQLHYAVSLLSHLSAVPLLAVLVLILVLRLRKSACARKAPDDSLLCRALIPALPAAVPTTAQRNAGDVESCKPVTQPEYRALANAHVAPFRHRTQPGQKG